MNQQHKQHYFFAGGGTGGHIYPALAIAEQLRTRCPDADITFFCSTRRIDSHILSGSGFEFIPLPGSGVSLRPDKLFSFCVSLLGSYCIAKKAITSAGSSAIVIGTGGFVAAPVILAAHRLKVPIALLNVDIVPGRANKLLARFAGQIFVQFAETAECFAGTKARVTVTGCPLRQGFRHPDRSVAIADLGLDENKKTLLITGASSGSTNINSAVCSVLPCLAEFVEDWQIVHLAGKANYEKVRAECGDAKIAYKLLDYYDDMPNLLAAADLVIGRAGAVSVAEYAAAGVPAICLPYPYHADKHQYLNAEKLVEAGGAVVVNDLPDTERTAKELAKVLLNIMKDDEKRGEMAHTAATLANLNAAEEIAESLVTASF